MSLTTSEWLKSSDPVMPVGSSVASDVLSTVGTALSKGVCGIPDMKRSGFYDVEISGRWFYIHIPDHLSKVPPSLPIHHIALTVAPGSFRF